MYNILVCDDDKEIVEAIEIYLSQEGYKVLKAYDGEEALKLLDKHKVDLLIGWNPRNVKNPGKTEYADHYSVCKVRGCR